MAVHYIPEGYTSVTPYLVVDDAAKAIDFYKRAFCAEEKFRMPMGDRIGHAEIVIGDSHVMLADEFPEMDHLGPRSRGGATSSIVLYVEDVDRSFRKALDAGATEKQPIQDQFWGDRMGSLADPFGHLWSLATHKEEVSSEEMQRRMAEWQQKQKQGEPA